MKKINAGINPIIGPMSSCDECQIPRDKTTREELIKHFKEQHIIETENMKLLDDVPTQSTFGIYAPTSESFKNYLESLKIDGSPFNEWRKAHPESKDHDFLTISLACGCIKKFKDIKDVPFKSTKCKHGNYFIKIGDGPDDNI